MASFMAAGTAYANYGVPMIPFYVYYSMFGYQRVGDMVWAARRFSRQGILNGRDCGTVDAAGRGTAASGRTFSPMLFSAVPTCAIFDPALRV